MKKPPNTKPSRAPQRNKSKPIRKPSVSRGDHDHFTRCLNPETKADKDLGLSAYFFREWYRATDKSFYFLFKKNRHVTNIQYAELLALLQSNTRYQRDQDLQFVTTSHFRNWFDSISTTLKPDASQRRRERFSDLYLEQFRHTVIVNPYYTSCSVHLPSNLEIDLKKICGLSGYIHSCGQLVFVRNTNKARPIHLEESLRNYLDSHKPKKKIFFTTYSHEDFTAYDRSTESELRDGLDDVKIYIDKFYMGTKRLPEVLQDIKRKFNSELVLPDPGDFREVHREARRESEIDQNRTLWLIKDRGLADQSIEPGQEVYFVCYEQHYKNENAFHIFDENKPAWKSHTTIPHTLLGAMINLTRPHWENDATALIADPFAGSGTTWLESKKYPNVVVHCLDIEPIARLLGDDNYEFFRLNRKQLTNLESDLQSMLKFVEGGAGSVFDELPLGDDTYKSETGFSPKGPYNWSIDLVERVKNGKGDFEVPDKVVEELITSSLPVRMFFYVAMRTYLRNVAALQRQANDWTSAYSNELRILIAQVRQYTKLRKSVEMDFISKSDGITVFSGKYSKCCTILLDDSGSDTGGYHGEGIRRSDAREISNSPYKYDLIVTDPPYGFNTEDEAFDLAELWSQSLTGIIRALKSEGQLVICLPDRSHTGRSLQFFTQQEFVKTQVLSAAKTEGKEVIVPASILPAPTPLFRAPFYWESVKALRRSILHFRFRSIVSKK